MNKDFALNIVCNALSMGQTSYGMALEIFRRGYNPSIFPIANQVDLSSQKVDQPFVDWLNTNLKKANETHKKTTPTIKVWHIQDSLQSFSNEQILYTYHECDRITPLEKNILQNQKMVLTPSQYSVDVFKAAGVENVKYVPLYFDAIHHQVKPIKYPDDRIVFGLCGKAEVSRKAQWKVLKAWAKKYGNDRRYALNVAIYNSFMKPEDNDAYIHQALEGQRYFNINIIPFIQKNEGYNQFLNSNHIVLALSKSESWGLPEFHSVALGKHCVGLYAHGHKGWMTPENSVTITPSGMVDSHDGIFFHKGASWNQGCFHDWKEDDFINGCEEAIKRYQKNPVNEEGLKLQEIFTIQKTVDGILAEV